MMSVTAGRKAGKLLVGSFLLLTTASIPLWAGSEAETYPEYLEDLYRDTVRVIAPEDVVPAVQSNPDTMILDVRSEPERSVSFIEGSDFYDFDTFDVEEFLPLPRDTPIIAYCAVGWRSERVGEELIAAGFTNVSHVYGGIVEWQNLGLELAAGPMADAVQPESGIFDAPPVHGREPRWGRWVEDGNVVYEPKAR